MYDINLKNVKKGKNIWYIFLVVGLAAFVILIFVIIGINNKINSLDSETTSTSVDVTSYINDEGTTMYSPTYYYEVDGVEYSCGSNSSSSSYPGTGNKTVYYDSNDPSNCMSEYSKSSSNMIYIFLILPAIFIIISVVGINSVNKRIRKIENLNKTGKLVKGLPYRLEKSNIEVNGTPLLKPVVDYVLPSGSSIILYGDTRNDRKTHDSDGKVDLVIDEANPDNYFIDFEINRLSGNLPNDYYQPSQTIPINNSELSPSARGQSVNNNL